MPTSPIQIDHPLLDRLHQLHHDAAIRFPRSFDTGFACLGLALQEPPGQTRYHNTPLNATSFASTGVDGTHFSFLHQDGMVTNASPVILTVPGLPSPSVIVGESLHDFLCFGALRGFTAMQPLTEDPTETLTAFTDTEWKPTCERHYWQGYAIGESEPEILGFLRDGLSLRPWPGPERFYDLQRRFAHLIQEPAESPLPSVILFFSALNERDLVALASRFAAAAVVDHCGVQLNGYAAIQNWCREILLPGAEVEIVGAAEWENRVRLTVRWNVLASKRPKPRTGFCCGRWTNLATERATDQLRRVATFLSLTATLRLASPPTAPG